MKIYTKTSSITVVDGKPIEIKKIQASDEQINVTIHIDSDVPSYRLHINKREDNSTDICLVDLSKPYPYNEVYKDTILSDEQRIEGTAKCPYMGKKGDGFGLCGKCHKFHNKKYPDANLCFCSESGLSIPHLDTDH